MSLLTYIVSVHYYSNVEAHQWPSLTKIFTLRAMKIEDSNPVSIGSLDSLRNESQNSEKSNEILQGAGFIRRTLYRVTHSLSFEVFILGLIILNSVTISLQSMKYYQRHYIL